MPDDNAGESKIQPDPSAELNEKIGNIVNSAVTAHIKRFTEKALPELLANSMKPLADQLAAMKVTPPSEEKKGGKKEQDPETLAALNAIEDLKKQIKERDDRVAAAEQKARDEKAFASLRSALNGKVRPELADILAMHLFQVEKRVDFDESGNTLFKSVRQPAWSGGDPEEIKLPLAAGIEDFLKSDSAKPFLPAPTAGAGAPPLPKRGPSPAPAGDQSRAPSSDADKVRWAMEREQRAKQALNQ